MHLPVTYFLLLCPLGVPVRNRWYTKSNQIEELIKWQFITIRAGLKEAKEPGTARHPRRQ